MRAALALLLVGCAGHGGAAGGDGGTLPGGGDQLFGDPHDGEYELGPVEFSGSFPNACAPYPAAVEQQTGDLLAGVSNMFGATGELCDACLLVKTARGKSVVARIVTYGVTQAPGNIDVSSAAFAALNVGEFPRTMTWQLTTCPDTGKLEYQFQTGANPYWTSLWVRNGRLPVARVEVKSANHADWFALTRGSDGTLTDAGGFGMGGFSLRVTAVSGAQVTDAFTGFTPGDVVTSTGQLQ